MITWAGQLNIWPHGCVGYHPSHLHLHILKQYLQIIPPFPRLSLQRLRGHIKGKEQSLHCPLLLKLLPRRDWLLTGKRCPYSTNGHLCSHQYHPQSNLCVLLSRRSSDGKDREVALSAPHPRPRTEHGKSARTAPSFGCYLLSGRCR